MHQASSDTVNAGVTLCLLMSQLEQASAALTAESHLAQRSVGSLSVESCWLLDGTSWPFLHGLRTLPLVLCLPHWQW